MASLTVASNSIVLEVLNQHNYKEWSSRVETYLSAEDLWDVVTVKPPKREEGEAEFKAWKRKDAKALHAIKISCGTQLFSLISETRTAKRAWEVLEQQSKPSGTLRSHRKGNQNNPDYDFDSSYRHFFDSLMNGDWGTAKESLATLLLPKALRARDPAHSGHTALHIAAGEGHVHIVKELVLLMTQEDLQLVDDNGCTALHLAVIKGHAAIVKELVTLMREEALEIHDGQGYTALGRGIVLCHERGDEYNEGNVIEIIKLMVAKSLKILSIAGPPKNYIPVAEACRLLKIQVCRYLYSVTPPEALMPPRNGSQGASLVSFCLKVNEFDIPRGLLSKCPSLSTVQTVSGANSPIFKLSRIHYAFSSGLQLKFWQRWIYNSISIKVPAISDNHDLSIAVSNSEDYGGTQKDLVTFAVTLLKRLVKGLFEVLGINHVYKMKLIHVQMLEFVSFMGEATRNVDDLTHAQLNLMTRSIFEAIERGDLEFVTHVCKANPELVKIHDEKGKSIFHFAIECRQEEIYCLIYGLAKEKIHEFGISAANFNTTMLHAAANLSPFSQSTHIRGASLQMQRELQWFKEVESIVPVSFHNSRNIADSLTAREVFHKNHEKLMVEAEMSMKGIASSCTVVGALIVTIMFAAAFTIPGGNNGTTGSPMFIDEKLFFVFIASDAISLVSSTTCVIIFLGILTSRYSEEDFLTNLPTKMMIGLFTLFIAIATMMTAFSCGLIIMLHEKYSWIALPGILVASIPVASFLWMLFPLLVQTLISTYGPGIFNKKVARWC